MHTTLATKPPGAITWTARVLSALILLFWTWLIAGHLIGDAGRASRPLNANDIAGMAAMVLWLAGLALAWKKELPGGALALAAFSAGSVLNWRLMISPAVLVPVAALLFMASGWQRRRR